MLQDVTVHAVEQESTLATFLFRMSESGSLCSSGGTLARYLLCLVLNKLAGTRANL
jgi:hypothetical protein